MPTRFEQHHSPAHVDILVQKRLLNGRSNPGTGSQVNNSVNIRVDRLACVGGVTNVTLDKREAVVA